MPVHKGLHPPSGDVGGLGGQSIASCMAVSRYTGRTPNSVCVFITAGPSTKLFACSWCVLPKIPLGFSDKKSFFCCDIKREHVVIIVIIVNRCVERYLSVECS